ncbi:universal stress protein [Halobacillus aidingensis]|uniref:Nucleotide-binding universal stress protein, UspA family n=1 Tax=Halobacillus aidingensis TaxID=240303 RepID=A0A1H0UAL2_HALAD|nr:universal stress protein [Halobacillus aidingensis]SDP63342.1 Nucleotide-binding universal stress protein, UspA family [Halobacillus aidingensis]
MFSRILLASDGSAHAERAAENAAHLAEGKNGSIVTILYSVDGSTSKSDVLKEECKEALLQKRRAKLAATEEILKEREIDYVVKIIKGDPGPSIVKYANENQVDVVVIGSRGLNGLQEMVLGSVSHKVAKRAHCPVLIVK